MKKILFKFSVIVFALVLFSLQACLKDSCKNEQTFYEYTPIYKNLQQLRAEFEVQGSKELKSASKIYVYGDYLFINEEKLGIHIFDNTDPKNPQQILFLNIPGNLDMAIKNDILFADNYVDIIAIDISNIHSPKLLCRQENVFSPINIDQMRGLLVDYEKTERIVSLPCGDYRYYYNMWYGEDVYPNIYVKVNGGTPTSPGISGSTARFTTVHDYLYAVDQNNLYSFDISANCIQLKNKMNIGMDIETLFPFQENLFIGSNSGMFIYSVSNPSMPVLQSSVQHIRSCDPVVANENTAYVTLHGGSSCGGFTNQLDIIDIRNISNANLIKSYPMGSPRGLALDQNILYICDDGLKIYDVQNRIDITLIGEMKGINPHDVIINSSIKNLLAVSNSEITQFEISDPKSPKLLSTIKVNN